MPLPLPALAPHARSRSDSPESESASSPARRRPATLAALVAAPDVRAADDGTHDVFSEAYAVADRADADGSSSASEAALEPPMVVVAAAVVQMRQVPAVPVSLSAYL